MAETEFQRVGLTNVERFSALPGDTPQQSFNQSQQAMLKTFLATDKKTLLAFEDDVQFVDMIGDESYRNNMLLHLGTAVAQLPPYWDMLYLGANLFANGHEEEPPQLYTSSLARIYRAWTTHAVAYSRRMVEDIVSYYDVTKMYDAFLSEEILPNREFQVFIVRPMIAWQRPGYSDLWQTDADYTNCFIEGIKLLS